MPTVKMYILLQINHFFFIAASQMSYYILGTYTMHYVLYSLVYEMQFHLKGNTSFLLRRSRRRFPIDGKLYQMHFMYGHEFFKC